MCKGTTNVLNNKIVCRTAVVWLVSAHSCTKLVVLTITRAATGILLKRSVLKICTILSHPTQQFCHCLSPNFEVLRLMLLTTKKTHSQATSFMYLDAPSAKHYALYFNFNLPQKIQSAKMTRTS